MTGYIIATLTAVVAGVAIACWRAAERDRKRLARRCAHLTATATRLRGDLSRLSADNGRLRARNADLRDDLDIATGAVEPSLVAEWTAFLADITPEDFR